MTPVFHWSEEDGVDPSSVVTRTGNDYCRRHGHVRTPKQHHQQQQQQQQPQRKRISGVHVRYVRRLPPNATDQIFKRGLFGDMLVKTGRSVTVPLTAGLASTCSLCDVYRISPVSIFERSVVRYKSPYAVAESCLFLCFWCHFCRCCRCRHCTQRLK